MLSYVYIYIIYEWCLSSLDITFELISNYISLFKHELQLKVFWKFRKWYIYDIKQMAYPFSEEHFISKWEIVFVIEWVDEINKFKIVAIAGSIVIRFFFLTPNGYQQTLYWEWYGSSPVVIFFSKSIEKYRLFNIDLCRKTDHWDTDDERRPSTFYYYITLLLGYIKVSS